MKAEQFKATIIDGIECPVFEVPFNPAKRWGIPLLQLHPATGGHPVRGTLNGVPFESVVFMRARKYFVPVEDALQKAAGVATGAAVEVFLAPGDVPAEWSNVRAG